MNHRVGLIVVILLILWILSGMPGLRDPAEPLPPST